MLMAAGCHLRNFTADVHNKTELELNSFTARLVDVLAGKELQPNELIRSTDIAAAMEKANPPPFLDATLKPLYLQLFYTFWAPTFESNSLAYQWMATGWAEYGACDGGGGAGSGAVITLRSYTKSQSHPAGTNIDEYDLITERLKNAEDFRTARTILVNELQRIRDHESTLTAASDDIMVYGLRLQLTELVGFAALALCALQAMFFLYWKREYQDERCEDWRYTISDFPCVRISSRPGVRTYAKVDCRYIGAISLGCISGSAADTYRDWSLD